MATRDEERQKGEGRRLGLAGEARHQHVRLEVVHRHERLLVLERQRLGRLGPDPQADLEAGADGDGDGVDVGDGLKPGAVQRLGDRPVERFRVRVAGETRHDAAPLLVQLRLRRDRLA